MSVGQIADNTKFHPNMPAQNPNAVWTFGTGRLVQGTLPPPLIKARYGEPLIARVYNNMPIFRNENGGFDLTANYARKSDSAGIGHMA